MSTEFTWYSRDDYDSITDHFEYAGTYAKEPKYATAVVYRLRQYKTYGVAVGGKNIQSRGFRRLEKAKQLAEQLVCMKLLEEM